MTSVESNFNFLCGRPHGAGPPPLSTCIHLSLTPSPLCVDVINGWPLASSIFNPCVHSRLVSIVQCFLHLLPCLGVFQSSLLFLCHWISIVFFVYDRSICTLSLNPLFLTLGEL